MQSAAPPAAELQQLVAPITLYPDELVAQILAAATYPEQVVEADRWMNAHRGVQGQALAEQVDREAWDPSVKALTAFPSVLANMDRNLAWTSSLGDAYVNHEPDVMAAIQDMRRRAQAAGNLRTTPQTTVTQEGQTIVVQPATQQVVYLPQYDPWVVYGAPVVAWPGWYRYPGLFIGGPGVAFGASTSASSAASFSGRTKKRLAPPRRRLQPQRLRHARPDLRESERLTDRRLGSAPFHANEPRGERTNGRVGAAPPTAHVFRGARGRAGGRRDSLGCVQRLDHGV
jgi:hypothetical protein